MRVSNGKGVEILINQVTLVGRLTKDPELKSTPDGTSVTQITLAVNRNFRNHNGEIDTDFVQCTLWRKAAENTCHYCRKGALIGITGRLHTRHYDNREGKRTYVTEVIAETVRFLSTPKPRAAASESKGSSAHQYNRAAESIAGSAEGNTGYAGGNAGSAVRHEDSRSASAVSSPADPRDTGVAISNGGGLDQSAVARSPSDANRHMNDTTVFPGDQHIPAEPQSSVTVTEWHAAAADQQKEERELAF